MVQHAQVINATQALLLTRFGQALRYIKKARETATKEKGPVKLTQSPDGVWRALPTKGPQFQKGGFRFGPYDTSGYTVNSAEYITSFYRSQK